MHKDELPLRYTCGQDWNELDGRGRDRRCAECALRVYDLSARTESQARAFLRRARTERICVRYLVADDGQVVLRSSPGLPGSGLVRRFAAPALLATLLSGTPRGCDNDDRSRRTPDPTAAQERQMSAHAGPTVAGPTSRQQTPAAPAPSTAPAAERAREDRVRIVLTQNILGILEARPDLPSVQIEMALDQEAWNIEPPE